jgi:hypothetical protein
MSVFEGKADVARIGMSAGYSKQTSARGEQITGQEIHALVKEIDVSGQTEHHD